MNWLRQAFEPYNARVKVTQEPGLVTWPAAMFVWRSGFTAIPHRHPVIQLTLALRGVLRVRGGPHESWRQCGGALVRSGALHEIDARERVGIVLLGFVHPESELGTALSERIVRDIVCLNPRIVARWRAAIGARVRVAGIKRWVSHDLLNGRRPTPVDPRVQRVLTYVRQHITTSDDLSLAALAALTDLSRSRFLHLFTQVVGVPPRPYLRWLRVQRAACELIEGASATQAAHNAGFSDAAHMSRTFRGMLGLTPTDIALHVHTIPGGGAAGQLPQRDGVHHNGERHEERRHEDERKVRR
jgi:AraC-like DNA-binding protein